MEKWIFLFLAQINVSVKFGDDWRKMFPEHYEQTSEQTLMTAIASWAKVNIYHEKSKVVSQELLVLEVI